MGAGIRRHALGQLAVIAAVIVPVVLAAAVPAWAAAPSNDDISNATVITSLPFHDNIPDMTQATADPATDQSSCGGRQQTVWYTFTPAVSEQVAFDPNQSSDFIAIDLFTGSPGALNFVACGQGGQDGFGGPGVILNATGGTTYWIMASSACCILTGSLDLSVYLAAAPQATLSVNAPGTVDRGGNATISGTADCTGTVPGGAVVSGTVRESVGRLNSVTASFSTTVACGHAVAWTALAQPAAGKFTGGATTVNATASFCNLVGCSSPSVAEVINLKG